MSDQLEALLLGSIQLAAARKRIAALEAENAKLRLLKDMRRDLTEFELSADALPVHDCMFFKRQI